MPVGVRLVLYDDPEFLSLSPAARWFYCSLAFELLDSGRPARRVEKRVLLQWTGIQENDLTAVVQELENSGLMERTRSGLSLPSAPEHFVIVREDRTVGAQPKGQMYRKDAVLKIFRHWKEVMETPMSRLTDKRRKAVVSRLQDGYSVAQIFDAIDGCSVSDWHMGDNPNQRKYNDLELICRTGDKLEQFAQIAQHRRQQEKGDELTREYRERTQKTTTEGQGRLALLKRRRRKVNYEYSSESEDES